MGAVTEQYSSVDTVKAIFSWATPKGKIVSQTLDQLNSAPVSIYGNTAWVMLDSGAAVNCIKMGVLDSLPSKRILSDAQDNKMMGYG